MIGLTYFQDPLGLYKLPKEGQLEVLGMLRADAEQAEAVPGESTRWGGPPSTVVEASPGAWDRFNAFRVE